jgi:hypothetical protein
MTPAQPALDAMNAEAVFADWFRKNYPGPDTIIGKPDWHAPKIFRAVLYALRQDEAAARELLAAEVRALRSREASNIEHGTALALEVINANNALAVARFTIAGLEKRVEVLTGALRFYAEKRSYRQRERQGHCEFFSFFDPYPVLVDRGHRARQALSGDTPNG